MRFESSPNPSSEILKTMKRQLRSATEFADVIHKAGTARAETRLIRGGGRGSAILIVLESVGVGCVLVNVFCDVDTEISFVCVPAALTSSCSTVEDRRIINNIFVKNGSSDDDDEHNNKLVMEEIIEM